MPAAGGAAIGRRVGARAERAAQRAPVARERQGHPTVGAPQHGAALVAGERGRPAADDEDGAAPLPRHVLDGAGQRQGERMISEDAAGGRDDWAGRGRRRPAIRPAACPASATGAGAGGAAAVELARSPAGVASNRGRRRWGRIVLVDRASVAAAAGESSAERVPNTTRLRRREAANQARGAPPPGTAVEPRGVEPPCQARGRLASGAMRTRPGSRPAAQRPASRRSSVQSPVRATGGSGAAGGTSRGCDPAGAAAKGNSGAP